MIPKAPELGDKTPEEWIKHFLSWSDVLRFEFVRLKTRWESVQGSDQNGKHPGKNLTAGTSAFIGFAAPREMNVIKEAVIRFIPTVTGTINYTINVSHGTKGADEAAITSTVSVTGATATDDQISEADITALLSDVQRDNQVGIEFDLDALTTTTSIDVLGLYFKFI